MIGNVEAAFKTAAKVVEAYGELTYRRMLTTLDDPMRLARTFALLIPGWLARRFNALAPSRGWNPVEPPVWDEAAQAAFSIVQSTEDYKEGPLAFREKRKPVFTGN